MSAVAERIEGLVHAPGGWLGPIAARTVDPEGALAATETWLAGSGSPRLYAEELYRQPDGTFRLLDLFAACPVVGQGLVQNPEIALTILDDTEHRRPFDPAAVLAEGEQLLRNASNYRHGLDRVRFLKQRWTAHIVSHDLRADWDQPQVWRALSDLADVVMTLLHRWVWHAGVGMTRREDACPVLVVAFGKHGGREVNYSSDLDLVYVAPDELDDATMTLGTRFCEAFGRALEEPMGRGLLYRVDLRLRPYGGTGPILNKLRAFVAYYDLYAEAWEVQALLRSRPIIGPEALHPAWRGLRERTCFRRTVSEFTLDEMRKMRERIDEMAEPNDIKRSRGGIRDIEFATQIWQLVHRVDEVETTLDTLRRLEAVGALPTSTVATFSEHYTWLRKLEHRIQFESNRQTHCVPSAEESKRRLAVLMGYADAPAFDADLARRRETIGRLYADMVEAPGKSDRLAVLALVPEAASWLDGLPDPDAFYATLRSNRDSLERIQTLVWSFPASIPLLRASIPLTEAVISGEVEEDWSGAEDYATMRAGTLRDRFGHAVIRHALDPGGDLAGDLSDMADATLRSAAVQAEYPGWIVALGSLGRRDMGPQSDADIVLLVDGAQTSAEARASEMLRLISDWRREGMPLGGDVRLRPDGGKGLLVRSFRALAGYATEGMEDWERFALGHARVIVGDAARLADVLSCTLIESDRSTRLAELLKMKRRIETERVPPHHVWRDVKLGHGSLSDIEWTVRLIEMFAGAARRPEDSPELRARIRRLVDRRLLTVMESEPLQSALGYLQEMRFSVWAAGFGSEVLPENPAKLGLLADRLGGKDGNDVLERHRQVAETVRRIYLDTVARLTEEVRA
ncbi:MAG: hypothetical protein SFX74_03745 [Fimbriimonadaceae bacterium]|nr:hypothetical protein [Fimbriimonadaceae bacterium]